MAAGLDATVIILEALGSVDDRVIDRGQERVAVREPPRCEGPEPVGTAQIHYGAQPSLGKQERGAVPNLRRLIAIAGIGLPLALLAVGPTVSANTAAAASLETGSAPHAPSSVSSKPVSADAWTHKVCQSLARWEAKLKGSANSLSGQVQKATSIAGARKIITQFLQNTVNLTGQLVQQVDGAGTPKVDQGTAVAQFFHDGLTQLKVLFAHARSAAQNLPNDPQAFASDAQSLGTQIEDGGRRIQGVFQDAQSRFNVPTIDTAFRTDPACSSIHE